MSDKHPFLGSLGDLFDAAQSSPLIKRLRAKLPSQEELTPPAPPPSPVLQKIQELTASYFTPPADAMGAIGVAGQEMRKPNPSAPGFLNDLTAARGHGVEQALKFLAEQSTPGNAALNLPPGGSEAVMIAKNPGAEALVRRLLKRGPDAKRIAGTALEEAVDHVGRMNPRVFSHVDQIQTPYLPIAEGGMLTNAQMVPRLDPKRGRVANVTVNSPLRHADVDDLIGLLSHEGTHVGQTLRNIDRFKRSTEQTAKNPFQPLHVPGDLRKFATGEGLDQALRDPQAFSAAGYQVAEHLGGDYHNNPYEMMARYAQHRRALPGIMQRAGRDPIPADIDRIAALLADDPQRLGEHQQDLWNTAFANMARKQGPEAAEREFNMVFAPEPGALDHLHDFTKYEPRDSRGVTRPVKPKR